jgi:hypothetical protein
MVTRDQPGGGWTVVVRRRPARMVEGRPEGRYTDAFEVICCDCGDHPDLDQKHLRLHQETETADRRGTMTDAG